jgi:Cytochrome c oxidase subunit IV
MAEEVRFFLRTALYTVLIAAVYWFVSYETAGTVMLIFVSAATAAVVIVVSVAVRASRDELDPRVGGPLHRTGTLVGRLVGFSEPRRGAAEEPLAAGLEPIPTGSIWPLLGAAAATLLALGVVYGPWLLLPGIGVAVITVWGWLTQMDAR